MKPRLAYAVMGLLFLSRGYAQENPDHPESREGLEQRVQQLEAEVADLRQVVKQLQGSGPAAPAHDQAISPAVVDQNPLPSTFFALLRTSPARSTIAGSAESAREIPVAELPAASAGKQPVVSPQQETVPALAAGLSPDDRSTLSFLRETTVNLMLDTYYDYNFNAPIGRVNLLRAYDVLSNNFSLNQAVVMFDHEPDVASGRRWGGRLDLQFGQATDTSQGNPSNEPRPDIYRNIFQAYGTYIVPVGSGLKVDFGKWSSSLGAEGNYTKDQINYSRSYWFNFLPYYHMGVRASYPATGKLTLNYWLVNGTNQAEATNGFKDQLFGFTATPARTVSWTVNYYYGQDHPDRILVPPTSPIPVQPGLSFAPIIPAPDGRTHIFDTYAVWQATPKLSFTLEGDYQIQRLWQNSAPGESSAPSHVDGGAGYVRYQFTPKLALGARTEYLSDRGGLFSGLNQALKEDTVTFDYRLSDGFLMRYEWRRDYSNQPSFLTSTQGVLSKDQNTATLGLIWWWGRKEGSW